MRTSSLGSLLRMWKELERRGAVYARILFSVQEGQAHVDAVILYDGYAPPWHHELGEVEPNSDLGVALWVAGGGRDIEQGDVVWGDGEMGFTVAERAVNTAWNDHPPPVRRRDIGPDGQVFTVLIELRGGEGVVRRVDGEVMVTQDVHADGGVPLRADTSTTRSRHGCPMSVRWWGGFFRRVRSGPRSWMTVESELWPGSAAVRTPWSLSSPTMVTSRSSAAVTRPDLRFGVRSQPTIRARRWRMPTSRARRVGRLTTRSAFQPRTGAVVGPGPTAR